MIGDEIGSNPSPLHVIQVFHGCGHVGGHLAGVDHRRVEHNICSDACPGGVLKDGPCFSESAGAAAGVYCRRVETDIGHDAVLLHPLQRVERLLPLSAALAHAEEGIERDCIWLDVVLDHFK